MYEFIAVDIIETIYLVLIFGMSMLAIMAIECPVFHYYPTSVLHPQLIQLDTFIRHDLLSAYRSWLILIITNSYRILPYSTLKYYPQLML